MRKTGNGPLTMMYIYIRISVCLGYVKMVNGTIVMTKLCQSHVLNNIMPFDQTMVVHGTILNQSLVGRRPCIPHLP